MSLAAHHVVCCSLVVVDPLTFSHMASTEVIGYLAGRWDDDKHHLTVTQAHPCRALEGAEGDGNREQTVEMDPVSEILAPERIKESNLDIVGWWGAFPPPPPVVERARFSEESSPCFGLGVVRVDPLLTAASLHTLCLPTHAGTTATLSSNQIPLCGTLRTNFGCSASLTRRSIHFWASLLHRESALAPSDKGGGVVARGGSVHWVLTRPAPPRLLSGVGVAGAATIQAVRLMCPPSRVSGSRPRVLRTSTERPWR